MIPYCNLNGYLRNTYGARLNKICIDGGFTCPNRDGKCGTGGCVFCGERGAGDHIKGTVPIGTQVETYVKRFLGDVQFIAYFQNFTNTYAPVEELKKRYDAALIDPRIRVLEIGTRPDCIDEAVGELLESYDRERDVWVELGLQTANDKTAKLINRGYTREVFEKAVEILHRHGLKTVVHLIVGLPGETFEDFKETIEYINRFPLFGIKIHSLYVMKGTELERMYREGLFNPQTMDEYVDAVVYALLHLRPDMVIHRLKGDCPRDLLVAPEWNTARDEVLGRISKKLNDKGLRQGDLFGK